MSRVGRLTRPTPPSAQAQPRRRRPARLGSIGLVRRRRSTHDFLAGVEHVAAAFRRGAGPEEAWRSGLGLPAPGGVPTWPALVARAGPDAGAARAVLAAAVLSMELGAAPASTLHEIALSLAREHEAAGQRSAALAGPRATARLLAGLPGVGVLLGLGLGADPLGVLLDGGTGSALLCGGVILTCAGRWWTGRCVQEAARAGGPG